MHENEERVPLAPYRLRLWVGSLFGLGCLVAGGVIGRTFFPLEIPKPLIVEKIIEKRVEVPVERIVEKRVQVPVEVIKYVDRMVPVEKIVYRDRETSVASAGQGMWLQLKVGFREDDVRGLLGEPRDIRAGNFVSTWYYGANNVMGGSVSFAGGKVSAWSEPSR